MESDPMNGTVFGDARGDLKVAVDVDLVESDAQGLAA
jgi:hypothetical protein